MTREARDGVHVPQAAARLSSSGRWPTGGRSTCRAEECTLSEQPDPAAGPSAADAASGAGGRPRTRLLLALAAAVILTDLVTKLVVVATIEPGEDIRVLGGALYLTQLRNVGAAFSFAEGATVLFSLVAVVVAVIIVRTARRLYSTGWAVTLGLVLGGALGNLIDRIFRDPGVLRGGVVDFLSVFAPDGRVWPVFNVADSAIVCGGILGALLALRGIEFDGSRGDADETAPAPAANGGTERG
jgi:signal peptidase II